MGQDVFTWNFKNTAKESYSYKGKKNKTAFPDEFVNICKMSQSQLKDYLSKELTKYYGKVLVGDGYIYAPGTMDVCMTAHMDTVHKELIKDFYGFYDKANHRNIISSPQGIGGDDRCGVYMIMNILKTSSYRPYIVFCEDEEIGGIGSDKFVKTNFITELEKVKFFIELDRANAKDLVFYDDENTDFHAWCETETGYKENWGSFSDISTLCPTTGVSGVNISCGYYNAHSTDEYVVLEEMNNSIIVTKKLLAKASEVEQFEYIEFKPRYRGYGSYFSEYYGYSSGKTSEKSDFYYDDCWGMEIYFEGGKVEFVSGTSEEECIGSFLINHPNMSFNEIEDFEFVA